MEKQKYFGGINGANTYYHYILKPFAAAGHTIANEWVMSEETMVGTFLFTSKHADVIVYATPYWEEVDGVDISVVINGITAYHGECQHSNCVVDLPLPTGDSKVDSFAYFAAIMEVLSNLSAHN